MTAAPKRWPYIFQQSKDHALIELERAGRKTEEAQSNLSRLDGPNWLLLDTQLAKIQAAIANAKSELRQVATEQPPEAYRNGIDKKVKEQLGKELDLLIDFCEVDGLPTEALLKLLRFRRKDIAQKF
jgi:hypothetical protein